LYGEKTAAASMIRTAAEVAKIAARLRAGVFSALLRKVANVFENFFSEKDGFGL